MVKHEDTFGKFNMDHKYITDSGKYISAQTFISGQTSSLKACCSSGVSEIRSNANNKHTPRELSYEWLVSGRVSKRGYIFHSPVSIKERDVYIK